MRGSSSRFALTARELDEIAGDSHSWRDLSSPALIAAIEETNAVDTDLYRFAVQRFEECFGEPWLGNGNGKAPELEDSSAYRKEQDMIIHEILYFWPMTKKKEELKELDE